MSSEIIAVLLKTNQFRRLRIRAEVIIEIYQIVQYMSQFILDDNNTTDTYPDQVQFFFKYIIYLPEGSKTYYLAFVR